ncbi:hypothetical protein KB553_07480 [Chryseobacterium rhizoplanae]|uniref:hypothetical protein n=1 Tax=Chryseobacterium rhizoplanae TaxID=1609531 RepID=UPI001CE39FDF|nr:hypothetical protein [Chryseobacterium rhizoplanae]UCA61367.1 hypothetical protein KB553_07480 [Chryseobacterium rhizoplanae]
MTKNNNYRDSIIKLIGKAKKYNPNLGNYVEHINGQNNDFVVALNNNYAVKIPRRLAIDYSVMESVLTEDHLIEIAKSAYEI